MTSQKLQDIANIVTAIVAPILTILAWLITRERFAKFWSKRLRQILVITTIVAGMTLLWLKGWLDWLQYPVTWPVWWLILYPFVVFGALVGFFLLYDRLRGENTWVRPQPDHYEIYGARWRCLPGTLKLVLPPICAECLMEMRLVHISPLGATEAWECRQCQHMIHWDRSKKGDLLEDVQAHFNAELRRESKQSQIAQAS